MAHEVKLTTDGLLINWLKDVGETVSASDIIAEVEADKATVEIEAGSDGTLLELRAEPGDEIGEGSIIAVIGGKGETAGPSDDASDTAQEAAIESELAAADTNGQSMTDDGRVKASPLARRMATDKGIELGRVKGSGPGGRIIKSDIENFAEKPMLPPMPAAAPSAGAQPDLGQAAGRGCRCHPLNTHAPRHRRWHHPQQEQYAAFLCHG